MALIETLERRGKKGKCYWGTSPTLFSRIMDSKSQSVRRGGPFDPPDSSDWLSIFTKGYRENSNADCRRTRLNQPNATMGRFIWVSIGDGESKARTSNRV